MGRLWMYGEAISKPAGKKVCIATPSYGDVSPGYVMSAVGAYDQLRLANIEAMVIMYSEHCHVDDSRNHIVKHFLETDCTELVFMDADIQWNPADIVTVLKHDCDVVGGVIRLKEDDEDYAVKLLDNDIFPDVRKNPFEVYALGTAFMRIRRNVFEKLAEKAVSFPDKHFGGKDVPIIFERSVGDHTRWGGDYTFCRKWRELGGRIYADASFELWHQGIKHWQGLYSAYVKKNSGLGVSCEIAEIKAGKETCRTIHELCLIYGNEKFAATPEMLQALIMLARERKGNILEVGSGLSTLVMAAANPEMTVWAFEEDKGFQEIMLKMMKENDLKNVRLVMSRMKDYGAFDWYELPEGLPEFDMVLVDGPKRNTRGGRTGVFPVIGKLIKEGAVIVYDDFDTHLTLNEVSQWGGKMNTMGSLRTFAITTKSLAPEQGVSVK